MNDLTGAIETISYLVANPCKAFQRGLRMRPKLALPTIPWILMGQVHREDVCIAMATLSMMGPSPAAASGA